ncbi:hypothetical protein D3C80_1327350 [compost metagenome]
MNAIGVHALALQALDQLVDTIASLGEHQHLLPALLAQQVAEQLGLALLVHRHHPLLDGAGRFVARADFDAQRVIQHLLGQQANGVGKGRGEQQRLPALGQRCINIAQLFAETQVEHAVGFVEHQRLQLGELHGVLAVQIQ